MSTNEYIQDSLIRHQVYLQRYAGGVSNEIKKEITELTRIVANRMLSGGGTALQVEKLAELQGELFRMVAELEVPKKVIDSATDLAANEVQFMESLLDKATSANIIKTSPELVYSAIANNPLSLSGSKGTVNTLSVNELVNKFDNKVPIDIINSIRIGVGNGDSNQKIAREVFRLTETRTKTQADSLVRTVVNHIGTEARQVAVNVNSDIIVGEEFVATLDSRTTLLCAGYDGKIYPIGLGPIPPLHYGCRSIRSPKIDPKFGLDNLTGKRPSVGDDGPKQVSGKTTYNSWMKRQPKEFQDDVLGPGRAEIFRSGKIPLERFTDPSGRILTLEELGKLPV